MELNKILDLAIMRAELSEKPELGAGYTVKGREKPYENYLDNNSWKRLYDDMDKNHHSAFIGYGNGGGKELEEHTSGAHTYPPKMASFGSSSRMIYNLAKDTDGFCFEEKLPTTIGGTANLDGFKKTTDKCIFVEAKCREPYSKKSSEVERKYQNLYEFISGSSKTTVTCIISDLADPKKNATKMNVKFKSRSIEINNFDMKQMICHLLGIATAFLNGKYDDITQELQQRMKLSAEEFDFETAALWRDRINSLSIINQKQKIVSATGSDCDAIAVYNSDDVACVEVFFIRSGKIVGKP